MCTPSLGYVYIKKQELGYGGWILMTEFILTINKIYLLYENNTSRRQSRFYWNHYRRSKCAFVYWLVCPRSKLLSTSLNFSLGCELEFGVSCSPVKSKNWSVLRKYSCCIDFKLFWAGNERTKCQKGVFSCKKGTKIRQTSIVLHVLNLHVNKIYNRVIK